MKDDAPAVWAEMAALAATLGPECAGYWARNERRFAAVMAEVRTWAGGREAARVLDIGPSFQTLLLGRLQPRWTIDTLGFRDERFLPGPPSRHWDYDLNRVDQADRLEPPRPGYDLILFLEVLEHLPIAPRLVLAELRRWLEPGGVMLLSTPNALWLKHRIKLFTGRHPFEPIREDRGNPGHFREYTAAELRAITWAAGYTVERLSARTLYGFTGRKDRLYARVAACLGPGFARDLLLVLRRRD
jgi:SAM-dependent methyltransferase